MSDLNDYLFEQLERVNDDTLTPEELTTAIKKAETIAKLSETIVKNGELALKTAKLAWENGCIENYNLPKMLGIKDGNV